jgi:hypothetical protein
MRRVLAILGACGLLVSITTTAAAKPPIKEADQTRDAGCSAVLTPLGTAEFVGWESMTYGTDAWIDVWAGEPYASDLVLTRDLEQPVEVVFSGSGVELSIPVVPAGTVTVIGTLTPADSLSFDDRFREGNRWYRSSAQGTAFTFSGALTLPGVGTPVPFGPDGCGGSDLVQTTFITQPNARVSTFTSTGGFCEVANDQGATAGIFGSVEDGFLFVDGNVTDAGGAQLGFYGGGSFGPDGVAVFETTEYDITTGEALGSTGSVSISAIDTGEAFSHTMKTSSGFERTRGSVIDIEGDLVTSLGSFSLDTCIATDRQTKVVETSSNGPKPGGKRPANDLPGGAVTVKAGFRASVATKGAQQPSEAGYDCLSYTDFDGTVIDVPVEHTVWYRLTGTGADVTVDTAGSSFDTVIAVYEGAPNDAATVACVDDVAVYPVGRTLQSAVTFTAAAGTSYWIQVGGLNEEVVFGPDPYVPYGTLRIAVR